MIDDTRDEDAFAERIARPLRAPERADATFEARAMSAVHAAARAGSAEGRNRSWWLRRRTLSISPLASLALAAGFAGLVLAGSATVDTLVRSGGSQTREATAVVASADTVHIIRFVLVDSTARRVALVGTFNQWQKGATLLAGSAANGVWTVDVPLSRGRHEYAFVVYDNNGERWVADPLSQTVRDDFGTESSVVSVGTRSSS